MTRSYRARKNLWEVQSANIGYCSPLQMEGYEQREVGHGQSFVCAKSPRVLARMLLGSWADARYTAPHHQRDLQPGSTLFTRFTFANEANVSHRAKLCACGWLNHQEWNEYIGAKMVCTDREAPA
jgi:hypothetical protein